MCQSLIVCKMQKNYSEQHVQMGSDCGSVGGAVASDTKGRGSNPVIDKIYIERLLSAVLKKLK